LRVVSIGRGRVRRLYMATKLLNDDGTASMATAIMSSHHAFRRDLACFADALVAIAAGDRTRIIAVADEWQQFRAALHGHHTAEDTGVFPDLRARRPDLAADLDTLDAQHREIDPLLERGDRAFADLDHPAEALTVVRALDAALAEHLALEERVVIPTLREAKQFPPLPDDVAAALYADGFAWSTAGLATTVITAIDAMLPAALVGKLPAARVAFDQRCRRVWGHTHAPESLTSVPRQ
jgi:hypothetical protein